MDYLQQKKELSILAKHIMENKIAKAKDEWGGAKVIIASKQPQINDSFYSQPRYVITKFSLELSWLFEQLRDRFSGLINGTTKIEFFGRLANAAILNIEKNNDNLEELLLAVLHEAFLILDELKSGEFMILPIAIGNVIYKEIEEGEKSGYLGTEATKIFFEELNKGG